MTLIAGCLLATKATLQRITILDGIRPLPVEPVLLGVPGAIGEQPSLPYEQLRLVDR
jgi:hypothetical protein